MRHLLKGRKLNRTKEHRKALFSNMATSLLQYEHIKTTLPKAKELRSVVEKLITIGKRGGLHRYRQLLSQLKNAGIAKKVYEDLSARYAGRSGGYTRVIKAGFRYGDSSPMAIIELVDRPSTDVELKKPAKKETQTVVEQPVAEKSAPRRKASKKA